MKDVKPRPHIEAMKQQPDDGYKQFLKDLKALSPIKITNEKAFLTWRQHDFRALWNLEHEPATEPELKLLEAMFCGNRVIEPKHGKGLVVAWRLKHNRMKDDGPELDALIAEIFQVTQSLRDRLIESAVKRAKKRAALKRKKTKSDPAKTRNKILVELANGSATPTELSKRIGIEYDAVRKHLKRLYKKGELFHSADGSYSIPPKGPTLQELDDKQWLAKYEHECRPKMTTEQQQALEQTTMSDRDWIAAQAGKWKPRPECPVHKSVSCRCEFLRKMGLQPNP